MVRIIALFIIATGGTAIAQDWSATFPPNRVATYLRDSPRSTVVIIPAGDPSTSAREAATALKTAIDQTGKAASCELAPDDARPDDAAVVRRSPRTADVMLVVRVFSAEGSAPIAVVGFFSPDGTSLSAITGAKGVPVEPRTEETASSVGVTQEARESISSVMRGDEGKKKADRQTEPSKPKDAEARASETPFRRFELTLVPVRVPIAIEATGDFGSSLRFGVNFNPMFGAYVSGFVRWLRNEYQVGRVEPSTAQVMSVDALFGAGVHSGSAGALPPGPARGPRPRSHEHDATSSDHDHVGSSSGVLRLDRRASRRGGWPRARRRHLAHDSNRTRGERRRHEQRSFDRERLQPG